MNLIDYLHYYIGSNVLLCKNLEGNNVIEPVTAKMLHEDIEAFTDDLKPYRLLLRRLEDMTRDDMKPIYAHIFSKPFPDSGRIVWLGKEERTAAKRFVMMSGVDRVGIEMTGYIWADCDLSHVKFNPHLIAHYLLRQHFDLFNLIDNNLAVDIKSIQ